MIWYCWISNLIQLNKIEEKRKYLINEEKLKEIIEPFLENLKQKVGRPTKVSHYKFFVEFYIF